MKTRAILAVISHLVVTSFAFAQTATGVIRGAVQDHSSVILIDVHVTLREWIAIKAGM